MIKNIAELIGNNQNLKSFNSKTVSFQNDSKMTMLSATQVKNYKRSVFSISGQLSGIDKQFSSCYSPNIFEGSITLNCEGLILDTTNGNFQVNEFLVPIRNYYNSNILKRIFNPQDILLVSDTTSYDENGTTTLVNMDDGTFDKYTNTFYNKCSQYKIYYPRVTRTGIDRDIDTQNEDLKYVINQSKLYSISLRADDKTYTLTATSLS